MCQPKSDYPHLTAQYSERISLYVLHKTATPITYQTTVREVFYKTELHCTCIFHHVQGKIDDHPSFRAKHEASRTDIQPEPSFVPEVQPDQPATGFRQHNLHPGSI